MNSQFDIVNAWSKKILLEPYFTGSALFVLAAFILGGAWGFQLIGGLKPCPLCLDQRIPWYILLGLAPLIIVVDMRPARDIMRAGLIILAIVVGLWAAYEALFHAGVEYGWWKGPATCTTSGQTLPTSGTIDLNHLNASDIVFCDKVPWSMFGVSLAGYNFMFSLLAVAIAASGLTRLGRMKR